MKEEKTKYVFDVPNMPVNEGWEELAKLYKKMKELHPGYKLYNDTPAYIIDSWRV